MDYINDDYKEEIEKLKKPKYKNKIEQLKLKLNIKYKNFDKNEELNEKFLSLIEIKITENFKIDFNKIYNDIITSNLFEIKNKEAFYIREFLFQKIYRYVIENVLNGNNEIIKEHFINKINTQLNNEITLNNLLDDIIIISNHNQYLNNSLDVIDIIINGIQNNEELLNIIIKFQNCNNIELKNRSKKGAGESVLFKEIIMINFKMNFSKAYTDLILKYADRYKPFKYNTKYSNKYYLEWAKL